MEILLLILTATLLTSCTDPDATRKTLDNLGFSNVEVKGYAPFACGDNYVSHTNFVATNPNGKRVKGTVCCGFLKGCSVKF